MRLTDVLTLRVDGRPVALARILLACALAICVLESSAVLHGIADGKLQYPALLPGPTPMGVQVYLALGLLAAICLLLGMFSGPSAAAGSVLLAGALLWDQQTIRATICWPRCCSPTSRSPGLDAGGASTPEGPGCARCRGGRNC